MRADNMPVSEEKNNLEPCVCGNDGCLVQLERSGSYHRMQCNCGIACAWQDYTENAYIEWNDMMQKLKAIRTNPTESSE